MLFKQPLYKKLQIIGRLETVQALADYILKELRSASYCAIYEEQLMRLWPVTDNDREAKIRSFAQERGLRLRFYCKGQCAVFDAAETAD